MKQKYRKLALVSFLIAAIMMIPLLQGCGGDGENGNGNGGQKEITLGILLDFSGPAGDQGRRNESFWKDMIMYTNEVDPIPGITLKTVSFDNEYQPAKTTIGYQYFKDRDVQVILCSYPQDGEILKAKLAEDKIPMFIGGPSEECLDPPGWIFAQASTSRNQIEYFLNWLSTEEWDYDAMGRSPKIGLFGWNMSVELERLNWTEQWIQDNPDKFEWIGAEIAPYGTTSWFAEANRLKDCDWIIVGAVGPGVSTFVNQATSAGFTGRYVVNWPQVAFWDTFLHACGEEAFIGTAFVNESPFYWEDAPTSDNIKAVLEKYHPDQITDSLNVVINSCRSVIECIRAAADEVGADNVDGEAIYNAALNIKFPPEILGHEAGYGTDRPSNMQRDCRPSARVYIYNPEAENDWDIITEYQPYPLWEGVTV